MRRYLAVAALVAAAACNRTKEKAPAIQTVTVARRDIVVDAQATGVIEPITIIEVKSKASGMITKMTVETGTRVKPGDLLVQVDTRDVQNKYNQARADLDAAEAKLSVSASNKKRNDDMFNARVITAQEHESTALDYENSKAAVVRAKANLDIAKQALEDATVTASSNGTIIEKDVSVGQVIASATGSVSGGTTLLKMADLGQVRIRALFNETDIGSVRPGQQATVTVDAYPDRRFQGLVEKIEPQAVIQQNVTMFPVLVTLGNQENLLKPGMNGEVSVLIDQRDNVLAVPNDAVKNPREAVATAPMLGLDPDSVQAQVRAQFGGGRSGGPSSNGGGFRNGGGNGGSGGGRNGAMRTSGGEVALAAEQQSQDSRQGFQQIEVSDADCAKIDAVLKKHPKEKKQLDDLRAKLVAMRGQGGGFGGGAGGGGGNPDFRAIGEQTRAIYTALNIDPRTAGACRRRADGSAGGFGNRQGGGGQVGGGSARAGGTNASRSAQGAQGSARDNGQLQPSPELGAMRARTRMGLVFVAESSTYKPRIVQLGAGNYDFTEVVSGLREGEKVVLLTALGMQAQREQMMDRVRQNTGPLGGGPGGGARGGAAPRGR